MLVLGLDRRSRIEPALQRLHWHSVHFKIIFEIAILMYFYKNCSTSSLSSEPSRTHHVHSIVDVAYRLQPPELPSFSADNSTTDNLITNNDGVCKYKMLKRIDKFGRIEIGRYFLPAAH